MVIPSGVQADGTAPCNTGSGIESTECGVNAEATMKRTTAVGLFAGATASLSTAVGAIARAATTNSTAVGTTTEAAAAQASALGVSARAGSANATMLGYSAGLNGGASNTDSPDSIAIGYFANISPASPRAIAIGGSDGPNIFTTRGAQAKGHNAIAIGFEARATKPGAIAWARMWWRIKPIP